MAPRWSNAFFILSNYESIGFPNEIEFHDDRFRYVSVMSVDQQVVEMKPTKYSAFIFNLNIVSYLPSNLLCCTLLLSLQRREALSL